MGGRPVERQGNAPAGRTHGNSLGPNYDPVQDLAGIHADWTAALSEDFDFDVTIDLADLVEPLFEEARNYARHVYRLLDETPGIAEAFGPELVAEVARIRTGRLAPDEDLPTSIAATGLYFLEALDDDELLELSPQWFRDVHEEAATSRWARELVFGGAEDD